MRLLPLALISSLFGCSFLSAQVESSGPVVVPTSVLKRYDHDKNGSLDVSEMARWEADKAARIEKQRAEREAILARYDTDRDGRISETEKAAAKLERERERTDAETARLRALANQAEMQKAKAPAAEPATEGAAEPAMMQ